MFWACGESDKKKVNVSAVNSAIKLIEYFRDISYKIFTEEYQNDKLPKLDYKQLLYAFLPYTFNKKDANDLRLKIINSGMGTFNEKTLHNYLSDTKLFCREGHNQYKKIQ